MEGIIGRKLGMTQLFGADGNLSLDSDPKQAWADAHPGSYPVNVNSADPKALLKVPGFGPAAVSGIMKTRRSGRIRNIEELGIRGARAEKIKRYVHFE